jgi:hypothetical protein
MNQPARAGPIGEAVALYISTKRFSVYAALATAFRLRRQAVKRRHGIAMQTLRETGFTRKVDPARWRTPVAQRLLDESGRTTGLRSLSKSGPLSSETRTAVPLTQCLPIPNATASLARTFT